MKLQHHTPQQAQDAATPETLLTKQQVAKNLNCSVRTVDNLISSKAISVVRIGRSVRFKPSSVVRLIQSYTINSAA
jgi:excisionase family DNA binding protein